MARTSDYLSKGARLLSKCKQAISLGLRRRISEPTASQLAKWSRQIWHGYTHRTEHIQTLLRSDVDGSILFHGLLDDLSASFAPLADRLHLDFHLALVSTGEARDM